MFFYLYNKQIINFRLYCTSDGSSSGNKQGTIFTGSFGNGNVRSNSSVSCRNQVCKLESYFSQITDNFSCGNLPLFSCMIENDTNIQWANAHLLKMVSQEIFKNFACLNHLDLNLVAMATSWINLIYSGHCILLIKYHWNLCI